MRDIRKPKISDTELIETINLYDLFQKAYKEMTTIGLTPVEISKLNYTKQMSDLLFIPVPEMAAFIVIINRCDLQSMVLESEIVNFLRAVLNLQPNEIRNAMRNLKKMALITNFKVDACTYYYPSRNVSDSIDNNSLQFFRLLMPKGLDRILDYWATRVMDSMHITLDEIESAVEDIIHNNSDLIFIKYINSLSKTKAFHEKSTLLSICCNAVFSGRPFSLETWERFSCFTRYQMASIREQINSSTWKPIADGYLKFVGGNYIQDNISVELTEKGYNFFFKEMDNQMLKILRSKTRHTSLPITQYKSINAIELFFNDEFQDELDVVAQLLTQQTFKIYQKKISKNTRMAGLTFLFHGFAGTGKTELVYNLAKKTKRNIVKIQVTDIASKWVGQSEQNLLRVFEDYRLLVENEAQAPILFLNECDQLINKRVDITGSVDSMSNALQNIFLEQMETFPGILVGTTNLVNNMDTAFERRWTYKIAFDKPNRSTQGKIWKAQLPQLPSYVIDKLTQLYDFTPAEINNVIKRFEVNQMLFPEQDEIKTLLKMGKTETFSTKPFKSIGFEL